jgi:DNA-binding NarL/FixJ family response regulator
MTLSGERPVRVFLADEHPIFLAGLRSCLEGQYGIEVVGEANDVARLIDTMNEAAPHIAVVSATFNGVSVIETLLVSVPLVRFIVLVEEAETARARQMISLGARGYVLKQSPRQTMVKAITAVLRGEYFLDEATPDRRVREIGNATCDAVQKPTLTHREREVLRLIALGFSVREAAVSIDRFRKNASRSRDFGLD